MDTTQAIKKMMQESGTTATQLSLGLGKHRNFVTTTFAKGSTPRADTLAHMADVIGYDLGLRKRGGGGDFLIAPEP